MNIYQCITEDGEIWYAQSLFAYEAVRKVETFTKKHVSCYFGPLDYTPPSHLYRIL